jgi:hypothetical protein
MTNERLDEIKRELAELDALIEILDPANPIEGQQLDVALTRFENLEHELEQSLARTKEDERRSKFRLIKGGKE